MKYIINYKIFESSNNLYYEISGNDVIEYFENLEKLESNDFRKIKAGLESSLDGDRTSNVIIRPTLDSIYPMKKSIDCTEVSIIESKNSLNLNYKSVLMIFKSYDSWYIVGLIHMLWKGSWTSTSITDFKYYRCDDIEGLTALFLDIYYSVDDNSKKYWGFEKQNQKDWDYISSHKDEWDDIIHNGIPEY